VSLFAFTHACLVKTRSRPTTPGRPDPRAGCPIPRCPDRGGGAVSTLLVGVRSPSSKESQPAPRLHSAKGRRRCERGRIARERNAQRPWLASTQVGNGQQARQVYERKRVSCRKRSRRTGTGGAIRGDRSERGNRGGSGGSDYRSAGGWRRFHGTKPRTVARVRKGLGLSGFLRKSVANFATRFSRDLKNFLGEQTIIGAWAVPVIFFWRQSSKSQFFKETSNQEITARFRWSTR